jgi:hypothetical protein
MDSLEKGPALADAEFAYMRGRSLSQVDRCFIIVLRGEYFILKSLLESLDLIDVIVSTELPIGYLYTRPRILSRMASKRSSSPKTPSRRPKLMRASATCPQLATSNASRKDLANLQSCGATTILTRVASYSMAQHEHAMRNSPSSCSSPGQRSPESPSLESKKEPFEIAIHQCQSYLKWRLRSANLMQLETTSAFQVLRTSKSTRRMRRG